METEVKLGGGSHKCPKCNMTIFGSVDHKCIEGVKHAYSNVYAIGQYELCCDLLGVSKSEEGEGNTLFEAVVLLQNYYEQFKHIIDRIDKLSDKIDRLEKNLPHKPSTLLGPG